MRSGAPVGLRVALSDPSRISAIISQNGNAYEQGLTAAWEPIQKYWKEPTDENRNNLKALLTLDTCKWQYTHGVSDIELVSPDGYLSDWAFISRPGQQNIQLDLFKDYASNVSLYPQFQQMFKQSGGIACMGGWLGGLAPIKDLNPLLDMTRVVYIGPYLHHQYLVSLDFLLMTYHCTRS